MNLYKVRYGQDEGVFEYEHFLNSDSLKEINSKIGKLIMDNLESKEHFPLLNGDDMELLRGCGGTVIYKNDNWVIDYLIDLDFKETNEVFDVRLADDWKSKVRTLISSIKRDIKINLIL